MKQFRILCKKVDGGYLIYQTQLLVDGKYKKAVHMQDYEQYLNRGLINIPDDVDFGENKKRDKETPLFSEILDELEDIY